MGHNEIFADWYGRIVSGHTVGDFNGVMPVSDAVGLKIQGFSENPDALLAAIQAAIDRSVPSSLPTVFSHGKNRSRRIIRIEPVPGRFCARLCIYNQ